MKASFLSVRLILMGAGLVLGLAGSATAGVIDSKDRVLDAYATRNGTVKGGGYDTQQPKGGGYDTQRPKKGTMDLLRPRRSGGGYDTQQPKAPYGGYDTQRPKAPYGGMNDTICLPKDTSRCPPVITFVLDTLKREPRCAPAPRYEPRENDCYRPKKPVDCYVPRTKKAPVCDIPVVTVNGPSSRPSLRDCKPTYGGSTKGTVCAPKKPGKDTGYGGGGNPTPEPASIALAAMGAAGAIARMRRRGEQRAQRAQA